MLNIYSNYTLGQVFHSSIDLFFLVFATIAVAISAGLIVCSDKVFRIFETMNGNISTRRGFRMLAALRDTHGQVARYRHWLAGFIVLGAAYTLVGIARLDDARIAAMLGLDLPRPYVIWLVASARLTLITFSLLSLAAGIMLSFFPRALALAETRLDKWYSTRVLIHDLERPHLGFDKFVVAFPQAAGWAILFPSLAVMLNSGYTLF